MKANINLSKKAKDAYDRGMSSNPEDENPYSRGTEEWLAWEFGRTRSTVIEDVVSESPLDD